MGKDIAPKFVLGSLDERWQRNRFYTAFSFHSSSREIHNVICDSWEWMIDWLIDYLFIYLFIYGCIGSLLLCAGFL